MPKLTIRAIRYGWTNLNCRKALPLIRFFIMYQFNSGRLKKCVLLNKTNMKAFSLCNSGLKIKFGKNYNTDFSRAIKRKILVHI